MIEFGIGVLVGFGTYYLLRHKISPMFDKEIPINRRGILTKGFTDVSSGKSFSVQFELGELENTKDKSKVTTINMIPSSSEFTCNLPGVKKVMDNSWIESGDIEWIEKSTKLIRSNRIKDILK